MPYSSSSEVPSNVPEPKKRQFMEVFNSVYNDTKDEGRAMAAAYSAIKKADATATLKAQYANDIFTTEMEARARSMDLGLEGRIHVCDYDEQAVYMPGESEEEYLNFYREAAGLPLEVEEGEEQGDYPEEVEEPSYDRYEALRAIVAEVLKEDIQKARTSVSEMTKQFEAYGEVTKVDTEQRIVYGFASVVTKGGEVVVDRQGDVITAEEMEKAATNFMLGARNGLTMHKGEPTTTIVHSMPLTKQVMDAFGISSDKEGWLIAVKVHDDDTWDRMKKGEFTGFSIGGRARKVQLDD